MRTFNLPSGGTITTPDELVFAYNPNFIKVEGIAHRQDVTMEIYIEGDYDNAVTLALYGGKASLDMSTYLRAGYAGKAIGTDIFPTTMQTEVRVGGIAISFLVVYGSMFVGDTFNPSRRVRLWANYPQVVSYYHPNSANGDCEIYIQKDRSMPVIYNLPESEQKAGITNYNNQAETYPMLESGQIVVFPTSETTKATFTMQFDETFTDIPEPMIVNIEVDGTPQCDDHIFLRWLDKWGMWQYWLFKIGDVSVSDAVVGGALVFLTGTRYPYYATRNIGKSLVRQVSACAPSVNREQWDFLATIKGSVSVCAFDVTSQSWVAVDIAAESTVWRNGANASVLQDFPLKVVFPTIQHQTL